MLHRKNLFVFDIETVIDCDAGRALLNMSGQDDEKVREELVKYHLDITDGKNSFVRQPFHKIVSIAFLEAEIIKEEDGTENYILKEIRAGGNVDSTEKELVGGVFKYLANLKPRLVSFNGRTFDVPVLKYRAMLHGISAPWFYKDGDKWNNYMSRYSLDWHCDLLEAFSDFGASSRVRMSEVCALFGMPGKIEVDGSKVQEMYNNGNIQEIRDYCELDVLNTYILYLQYMRHTGTLVQQNFKKCIVDLRSYLENESASKPHFRLYIDNWNTK